jgi:hypothetical protein
VRIDLTRDSVCMGDDVLAPNPGWIDVPESADPLTIGRAILRARYLPSVASGSTWHVAVAGAFIVMSDRPGQPPLLQVGAARPGEPVTALRLSYDLQRNPDMVAAELESHFAAKAPI